MSNAPRTEDKSEATEAAGVVPVDLDPEKATEPGAVPEDGVQYFDAGLYFDNGLSFG